MFPPKIAGIIGSCGKMAVNVVYPLFQEAGCTVIGSDPKNPNGLSNGEVVERADVVYVSVLPIHSVASVIRELIPFARPETLWLHGTSIQNPVRAPITNVLLDEQLARAGTDVGFLHFMFGPNVRSLRGQSVMYSLFSPTPTVVSWERWLTDILKNKRLTVLKGEPDSHDLLTVDSQLVPMLNSLVSGALWASRTSGPPFSDVLRVAGPPCWLQSYGMLRNLSQGNVLANIIVNHPHTKATIARAKEVLRKIEIACEEADVEVLAAMALEGRSVAPKNMLEEVQDSTNWHIRLEGDLRGGAVCFAFSAAENTLGLFTKVLGVFDRHGLDKTSSMAQETPDGGCRFYIGLKGIESPNVRVACAEVLREIGGEIITVPS